MNLLHIEDLGEGRINVSWRRDNTERECNQPIHFNDPLTEDDYQELRWYLEDYLEFPYGAEPYRAQKIQGKIVQWGTALFQQIFADPDHRDFYREALLDGLNNCELYVSSNDPKFLSVPWEIIFDPTEGRGFLAHLLGGLYRQHVGHKISEALTPSEDQPFRILLIIARPFGERDIPLGTVARPMLEALRPLYRHINLEVLRPPTFKNLVKLLESQPGQYQLVHFDGHGSFGSIDESSNQSTLQNKVGWLVFENLDGSPHCISSQELGLLLANCRVPLFVLNACRSAVVGRDDPFSSVASKLIATGAKGVLAMSYSVYSSTSSKFVQRFYESLMKHKSLAEAVASGRQRLFDEPEHNSVAGKIKLWDWMVPALYQQENYYVPLSQEYIGTGTETSDRTSLLRHVEDICPEGMLGFIGRDYDILRLERAVLDDNTPWVLITGVGGTGKTALAYGFARWFAETGGCSRVYKTSFKAKADFGQVIGSIVGFGTDLSRLSEDQQLDFLINYLHKESCLLVWDNFETVDGYPTGYEPLATDEERAKLGQFLRALRGGKSRVIITTRKLDEAWLGIAYNLIPIRGLTSREARQMAQVILKTIGKTPDDFKNDLNYARLIDLLRGHPRSLEVVLTQLRFRSPGEVIETLQNQIESSKDFMDASFEYVFEHLSPETKRHLPQIGLFTAHISMSIIGYFVSSGEWQAVYKEIIGERLDADGWKKVLMEAAYAGLVRHVRPDLFELHPTFPAFLRKKLAGQAGQEGVRRLDVEFTKLYTGFASSIYEGLINAETWATDVMMVEEPNVLRAMRLADKWERWTETQHIIQSIDRFYEIQGRLDEFRALRSGLLRRVGREIGPSDNRDKANLWMFLLGNEAKDNLDLGNLDKAEMYDRCILEYLISLNDSKVEPKVAVAYYQLGRVAQERYRLEEAEEWYRKALEIREHLRLEAEEATDYHQLGVVVQERQKFDEAEMLYKKALKIRERLGLEREAADDYHQLGNVAYLRQKLGDANKWYKKALEIRERLGLEGDAATDYHQLGMIAQNQQSLDEAEMQYKKALEICERLGLEQDSAREYFQLGTVIQGRQRLDEAEIWYKKALEVFERPNSPPVMVNILSQMGLLKFEQNLPYEAVAFLGKALSIAAEYKMSIEGNIQVMLACIMSYMGEPEFVATWRQGFHKEPPLEALRKIAKDLRRSAANSRNQ